MVDFLKLLSGQNNMVHKFFKLESGYLQKFIICVPHFTHLYFCQCVVVFSLLKDDHYLAMVLAIFYLGH
jgi:hypothetical protein